MLDHTQNFSMQRKIFDPRQAHPAVVIGAGSVEGYVVEMLAQIGCAQITVWDGDDIASHNIPQSIYRIRDLGRLKISALAEIVEEKTGIKINGVRNKWNGEPLRGSVICCVDDMDTRLAIWKHVRHNPLVDIFIDTRIDQEFIAVYCVSPCDPESIAQYEMRLYPSHEAKTPTCGEHGIVYIGLQAASAAVAMLTNHWKGGRNKTLFEMLGGCLQQIT